LAHRKDLDGEGKEYPRSEKFTAQIKVELSNQKAWEEWGMVNAIMVWCNFIQLMLMILHSMCIYYY
jgi:hypothetical protein